jgi:RNA polymerase sigma-70 factor (ECF subfamily)
MAIDRDGAVRQLVTHRARLLGYIRAIVRDPVLAEDVFQNVSVVVVGKCEAAGGEAGFLTWVRRVARYEALNAVRKRAAEPVTLDADVLDLIDAEWDRRDARPADALDALEACLDRLTPRARRAVEARYAHGRSGAELAAELGCGVGSVYVTLSRIYARLRECMAAHGRLRPEVSDV